MLIQTSKYNFEQAIEVIGLKIAAAGDRTFEVNTEFGNIFVQVTRNNGDTIYRYETQPWSEAPVNDHTSYQIRRKDVDHYVSIAKVHNETIQELMIVMALSECLARFLIRDKSRISHEEANFIAAAYMHAHHWSSNFNPYNLAGAYMKSVKSSGLFRPKNDSVTQAFMVDFFRNVIDAYTTTRRKDQNNFSEKNAGDLQFGDRFFQEVFEHFYRELRFGKLKSDDAIAQRYREVCSFESKKDVYSIPLGMRYIITGEK